MKTTETDNLSPPTEVREIDPVIINVNTINSDIIPIEMATTDTEKPALPASYQSLINTLIPFLKIGGYTSLVVFSALSPLLAYASSAEYCSEQAECGLALSDIMGKPTAMTLLTISGSTLVLIANTTQISQGIDSVKVYFGNTTDSYLKKAVKTIPITLLMGSSILHNWLTARVTETIPLQILSACSAVPSSLSAAVRTADKIPSAITSVVDWTIKKPYGWLYNHCVKQTPYINKEPAIEPTHIAKAANAYVQQLITKDWSLNDNDTANELLSKTDLELLIILLSKAQQIPGVSANDESVLTKIVEKIGLAAGIGVALPQILGNLNNILQFMRKSAVPSFELQSFITLLIGYGSIFNNLKYTGEGIKELFRTVIRLLQGQKIDSIAFQQFPALLTGGMFLNLALSSFSYSSSTTLLLKSLPENHTDILSEIWPYATIASSIIFHIVSFHILQQQLLLKATKSDETKLLIKLQNLVDKIANMDEVAFRYFTKDLDEQQTVILKNEISEAKPYSGLFKDCLTLFGHGNHAEAASSTEEQFLLTSTSAP